MDFLKLFTNVPENLVVVSPEYKILAATDSYLQVTMRKREDLIGLHFLLEAFPDPAYPYEENPVKKSLDKARESKKTDYLDVIRYDITKPDGTLESGFWEASHTPVLDEQKNLLYLIQKTTNVTERELAKKAAADTENKFQFMAEVVPQLIYTIDKAGKVTYVNQRWINYTGITKEAAYGTGWINAIHPDDLPLVKTRMKEALDNGTEFQTEMRISGTDGTYRWFLSRTLPVRPEGSDEITMWIGSSTDINHTRLLVQELLASNEQMAALSDEVQLAYQKAEAERKKLERLINNSPAFFCLLKGPEHRFEIVNQNYQKLFPHRDLLGKPVAEALPEVVAQGFIDLLDNVYNTGKDFLAEEVLVKLDRLNNGTLEDAYVSFVYQPIFNEEEKITGILVFGNEVTEQVKFRLKMQELGYV